MYTFSGLIASAAELLSSVSLHYLPLMDDELFNLFQSVVFCRPDNPNHLKSLSDFLLQISQNESSFNFISRLCNNGETSDDFISNTKYKIIQFRGSKF